MRIHRTGQRYIYSNYFSKLRSLHRYNIYTSLFYIVGYVDSYYIDRRKSVQPYASHHNKHRNKSCYMFELEHFTEHLLCLIKIYKFRLASDVTDLKISYIKL